MPDSFCARLRDTVIEALTARGDEVRLIDLYAEGFDPVMRETERRTYNDGAPTDPVLVRHAEHLKWAEALYFVYPTWWYGLPAMLKGWFDRAWAMDVAFTIANGRIKPRMTQVRKVAVVTTCGAPFWWSFLMGQPGRKTILRGIRAICSARTKTMFLALYKMDQSTAEGRAAFLQRVRRRMAS
jgi:NAD(P)H dehydrogenase (quinone)